MPSGDIFLARIVFSNAATGEELSIGIHGAQDGAVAPSINAIGDDVKEWWLNDHGGGAGERVHYSADVALERVTLRRVKPVEPIEFSYTTGLPSAGTDVGNSMQPMSAILVSLRTASIGRSYRGRVYLPPIAEDEAGAAINLPDALADDIRDQFQGLLDLLGGDQFIPVVYSRTLDVGTEITQVKVDRRVRTQRRRTVRAPMYS